MENWRNRNPERDTSENSFNSWRYQTTNSQNHKNLTSSWSSQNHKKNYFGLCRERRGSCYKLEDLIELRSKSSSVILTELIEKIEDFANFLESKLEPDWIVLTIAILSQVCSSFFRQTKISILKVSVSAKFLQTLEDYLKILQEEPMGENQNRNKHFWDNPEDFFVNFLVVCDAFIDIISRKDLHNLQKLLNVFDYIVLCLEQKRNVAVSQKTKLNIQILIDKLQLRQTPPKDENGTDKCREYAINDFRTVSILPTNEDILNSNSPFISTHDVEKRYDDVEHYLDEQYRIMKENLIAPLRIEIDKCREHMKSNNSHTEFSEIRIYYDVSFGKMDFTYFEAGVILHFSRKESLEEIFSPHSNSFGPGMLVCFTKDNFTSVLIGRVIKKNFEQQHLVICFEHENIYESNVSYAMIESKVYIDHCYWGLTALQIMSDVDFPMKNYLIDAIPNVESPDYLDPTSSVYTIEGNRVNVFGNNWPAADQLKLDDTQYSAFKAALTQKFVMIQGAPGTGKTHLGLQIVKTLLHEDNKKMWYNGNPILIVCLSNNALDQFLEGLISTTNKIIRVGNKCKSNKLMNFTLRSARSGNYASRNIINNWTVKLENLIKQLDECNNRLYQVKNFNNIINFTNFKVIDENVTTSWFSHASNEDLVKWLFDDRNEDLHAFEISEIINNIIEEKKRFKSGKGNATSGENFNISAKPDPTVLLSKFHMWIQILQISDQLLEMEAHTSNEMEKMKKLELEAQLKHLWQKYEYFKKKMIDLESSPSTIKPIHVDYLAPHNMDQDMRWNLYFYWLYLYKNFVQKKCLELQHEYREVTRKKIEIGMMLDLEIMKDTLVLGMTTTQAARLRTTLQTLKCRIVVVEDASQVLESHVVISLTKHCEHLILLGYQQLQLLNAANNSNKCPNMGISIMERMLRIKVPIQILGYQHRMNARITQLLVPHLYPALKHRRSVTELPGILGMPSCVFFVHHKHLDTEGYNSKTNLYEAKFLINVARYLREVGHEPSDITILAAYTGQVHILYDESKKYNDLLEGVRICFADSYQGEECKIILLSLVRNNQEGEIGCLQSERYVTLALSRAREALYMMGNIYLLCQNSEVWPKINEVLVKENMVGNYLPICCKIHPNHITKIEKLYDFDAVLVDRGSENCPTLDLDSSAMVCTELCSK